MDFQKAHFRLARVVAELLTQTNSNQSLLTDVIGLQHGTEHVKKFENLINLN